MNPFDIFIAFVSWEGGGKRRPVLVLTQDEESVIVFRITSQYETKSEAIRIKYFKINDWEEAGLSKQSYIDTGSKRNLPRDTVDGRTPIGQLSMDDKKRLLEFLTR